MSDPYRHPGCAVGGMAVFVALWSGGVLVIVLAMFVGLFLVPEPRWQRQVSAALHVVAMMSPFVAVAVLLWGWCARSWRVLRNPTGPADVRPTPTGWVAVLRNRTGSTAAVAAFAAVVFATAAVPQFALGKRNPYWVWGIAGPTAAVLAVLAYRWLRSRPEVVIDDEARTVTLPTGRKSAPLTVAWSAVAGVAVVRVPRDESADGYDCVVTVTIDGTATPVSIASEDAPEPVERFAAWLRERTGATPATPVLTPPS